MSVNTDKVKRKSRSLEELLADRKNYDYESFCARNSISLSYLHRLIARGLGPEVSYGSGKNLISAEAEREWAERMRNPTGPAAEQARRRREARSATALKARMARADMEGAR